MITDVCVPLSSLPLIMHETRSAINETQLPCPIVAHAGDGNFHVIIMFDPNDPVEIQQAKALATNMAIRAIELGGTCTGEHGIGIGKIPLLYNEYSANTMKLMELIKVTLDPFNLLNPNKIFKTENIEKLLNNHKDKEKDSNIDSGSGTRYQTACSGSCMDECGKH